MSNVISKTQLIKNTHVRTNTKRTFCWNKRPCYRYQTCEYCWNRRMRHLMKQLDTIATEWNLKKFITLNVDLCDMHYKDQLLVLIKMRPKVQRELRKHGKYITVAAIHLKDTESIAHYHILSASLDKNEFKKRMKKSIPFETNIKVDDLYNDKLGNLKKCLRYLLINWRVSLAYKP